jgi:3'-phosphoadenosine 5'-phosphosulfate sulfotransferase (PAPS reductase)/FAD synthetase
VDDGLPFEVPRSQTWIFRVREESRATGVPQRLFVYVLRMRRINDYRAANGEGVSALLFGGAREAEEVRRQALALDAVEKLERRVYLPPLKRDSWR